MTEVTPQKFVAVFGNADAQELLDWLSDRIENSSTQIEYGALAHVEGQRHVIKTIKQLVKKGQKND